MIRPRPEVDATAPAEHGGPAGTRDEREPVRLDFSTAINAWGPAPEVEAAARAAVLGRYPDPESLAARRAAARRWNRPVEEVIFAAGAAELIQAVSFAMLRAGDTVLIPAPSFGEYERAARLCGARVLLERAAAPHWQHDATRLAARVHAERPRLCWVCAPASPTGRGWTADELRAVADACAVAGTLLALDQSYDAFQALPLGTPALPGHPAVLHVRSLTKDHALAGLRVALGVAPVALAAAVERARAPWAASAPAQAAAIAALADAGERHLARTLPRLRSERARLEHAFAALGLVTVPTDTHFFLLEVGDAAGFARRLRRGHGIAVRDCASFGLPAHARVAARTPAENDALLRAVEEEACSS